MTEILARAEPATVRQRWVGAGHSRATDAAEAGAAAAGDAVGGRVPALLLVFASVDHDLPVLVDAARDHAGDATVPLVGGCSADNLDYEQTYQFDAEYVAVVRDGRTLESVGLPDDSDISDGLIAVAESGSPQLPFLGPCHMLAARASDSVPEVLVAARSDGEFSAEERQMVQGMAQVLALALRAIRTVNNERRLREEKEVEAEQRSQLLAEVRERPRLLEQLLEIQRAVSRREPLSVVLAAVAAGAAELLDDAVVAVVHGADYSTTRWSSPSRRRRCRSRSPMPARLGGDEFAVLVLDDAEGASGGGWPGASSRRWPSRSSWWDARSTSARASASSWRRRAGSTAKPCSAMLTSRCTAPSSAGTLRPSSSSRRRAPRWCGGSISRAICDARCRRRPSSCTTNRSCAWPNHRPVALEALLRWSHPERGSVDDFGTGYSSLAYLRRLPVDDLKIDRAFVDGVATTPEDLAVVRAVVDLSATLRMHAVAEGIEHAEQRDALVALGCEFGQGYHLARPMPVAEVASYLSAAPLRGRGREGPGATLRPSTSSTTLR